MTQSSLTTRNVRIEGRRTSVRLEPELWRALETIADLEKTSVNALCEHVHAKRSPIGGFTSALRVFIVEYYGDAVRRDPEYVERRPLTKVASLPSGVDAGASDDGALSAAEPAGDAWMRL